MAVTDYKTLRKVAVLSMVQDMVRHVAERSGQGRLRGRCEDLDRIAEGIRRPLQARLFAVDIVRIGVLKDRWAGQAGWRNKPKHVCTIVSFLLALVVDMFPGNTDLQASLQDVWDYYERAGRCPAPSGWAGTLAYLKFERVMEGMI